MWVSEHQGALWRAGRVTTKILEVLTSVTSQIDSSAIQHIIAGKYEKKVKNGAFV